MQLERKFRTTAVGLHKYLSIYVNWMLQLVLFYNAGKKAHSISKQSYKFKQEFNLHDQPNETTTCTLQAKEIKRKAKREGLKQKKEPRGKKPLHVRYSQRIQQADVDQENTHQWLHSVGLKDLSLLHKTKPLNQELPSKNNKKWD